MTTMPKPYGPEDERFVYIVTAAGMEALKQSVVAADTVPRAAPKLPREPRRDAPLAGAHD